MRVIAGKYKGQKLVGFDAPHVRPTTDRVKESIFNILMNEIQGACVLDLFSGTGNLGIEALSRGAEEVVFVESSHHSLQLIEQNLQKLKIAEKVKIIAQDVLVFLDRYQGHSFDLILIDPPFTEKMADHVMAKVVKSSVVCEQTVISIESSRWETIAEQYGLWQRFRFRQFGDKYLSCFRQE
jgi:16S rRNA (guanine966-N2)-methyltransferase